MSHLIDMTDGYAHMATATDNPAPWWESDDMPAIRVDPNDPPHVWRERALNWEVKRTQCQYTIGGWKPFNVQRRVQNDDGSWKFIDKRDVIYRDDNNNYLSIASDRYHIHSISQMVESMAIICDKLNARISTIGSLRDGREIWFMAKTSDERIAGEQFSRNVLLGTSYDHSRVSFGCITDVAVVCSNTLNLALARPDSLFRLSHRVPFDLEKLTPIDLGLLSEQQDKQAETLEKLASQHMSDSDMGRYFAGVSFFRKFGDLEQSTRIAEVTDFMHKEYDRLENGDKSMQRMARDIKVDRKAIDFAYQYGKGGTEHHKRINSRVNTAHGATQAVYNFVDHKMLLNKKGISQKNRFSRAFFGDGAKLKASAQIIALKIAA